MTCWVGGAGATGYASSWVRRNSDPSRTVLMAVLAALIFALQMLNFPVAAGTSGHFCGGVLAAILLGPWAACLVMTSILLVQAVLFGDGGLTALGANVLNMAVLAPFLGWALYRLATQLFPGRIAQVVGAFAAAWVAVVVSSLAASLELWTSGRAELATIATAMGFWHSLIGVGEGLVTAGIVAWLARVRPSLLVPGAAERAIGVAAILGVLALAAAGLSFLASGSPDGLEFVYFDQGLGAPFPTWSAISSPFAGYSIPGPGSPGLAGVAAGILGLLVTGVMVYGLVLSVQGRRAGPSLNPPSGSRTGSDGTGQDWRPKSTVGDGPGPREASRWPV